MADVRPVAKDAAPGTTDTPVATLWPADDTEDVEAYHLYLKGRFFWNKRTREGFQRGLALFEQAVERDPAYARAHAGVADSDIGLTYYEYERPSQTMPRAKAAALKALAIAPTLAEAPRVTGAHRGTRRDTSGTRSTT